MLYGNTEATQPTIDGKIVAVPQIDKTLTREGAAADAKATGDAIRNFALCAYPVGSIYQSLNPKSPADLFGGEWEQINDKFLLASGENLAGHVGGEKEHTLQVHEIPNHRHNVRIEGLVDMGLTWDTVADGTGAKNYVFTTDGGKFYADYAGGDAPHNNMPPYLVVYTWVRTA